VLITFDREMI